MKALIFDSTSEDLLVMLISGEKTDYIISSGDKRSHNSKILELADELLERNNLTVSDIEYVSSVTGPGSFTGIRIGVSTANALSYGSGAELVDVNAFEAMAYGIKDALCLIDALHGNYYFAKVTGGVISETGYIEKAQADEDKSEKVFRTVDRTYASKLAAVIKDKAEKNQTAKKLMPLYLRKSQAEREAEERGNL